MTLGDLKRKASTRRAEYAPQRYGIRPRRRSRGIRIVVVPDCQVRPGVPLEHLRWAGEFIADRGPSVVVQLGDFADMASISTHDAPGSLAKEGKRLREDLDAVGDGMSMLMRPVRKMRRRPRMVLVKGNHEERFDRFVQANPVLSGMLGDDPFGYAGAGWEVFPFLRPVVIQGIAFSHFFPRSASGKITQTRNGAPNALTMVKREMRSCVAGHTQGLDTACYTIGDRMLRGVIAGSFYLHDEEYLSEQGRHYWAGILELNEAADGYFDLSEVSIDFLCRRYGSGRWPR